MVQQSNLRTRKSFQNLSQLALESNLNTQDLASIEKVLRSKVYDEEQERLLNIGSTASFSMIYVDERWKDLRKKSKGQRLFTMSVCMAFLFILFLCGLLVTFSTRGLPKNHLYYNGSTYYDTTVIYISLDGFRSDYLERKVTPNIAFVAKDGIRAEYMTPSFPSITFPNHWTLATGLYPESHGIVANEFYDPDLKQFFVHVNSSISSDPQWWGGEPIWITSKKQNKTSAVIMWPGSNALIDSIEADYVVPYQTKSTAKEKMNTVLEWLDLPFTKRPQLISIYIPQIDQIGHDEGPEGGQMNDVLRDMDNAIGDLMAGLTQRNLQDHVHIVVASDHGMAASDSSKYIYYDQFISEKSQTYLREREAWPLLGLRVKEDAPDHALDQIYKEINEYIRSVDQPHFQVYKREDMPVQFHYNSTERIAPIILLPDVGYVIIRSNDSEIPPSGIHGYDNSAPEMRAIFIAKGPGIKKKYTPGSIVEPFVNVELYRFLTTLLDLVPAPNNATLDGVFTISL